MSQFSIPTSKNVGILPSVIDTLIRHQETAGVGKAGTERQTVRGESTTSQQVVAWAIASVATFVFATIDATTNVALVALKVLPVLFNETVLRVVDLYKYTPDGLKGEDLLGHLKNVRNCLLIGVNAAMVFCLFQSPNMVITVANKIGVIDLNPGVRRAPAPVNAPVDAPVDAAQSEVVKV